MKWVRRFIYVIFLTIWLAVMLFPLAAFKLARNGEFHVRDTRVFLIETDNEHGVGLHTTKTASNDATCAQTRIRYLLWEGESDPTRTCTCDDNSNRTPKGRACPLPEN